MRAGKTAGSAGAGTSRWSPWRGLAWVVAGWLGVDLIRAATPGTLGPAIAAAVLCLLAAAVGRRWVAGFPDRAFVIVLLPAGLAVLAATAAVAAAMLPSGTASTAGWGVVAGALAGLLWYVPPLLRWYRAGPPRRAGGPGSAW
jgi:hypothetical protein